MDEGAEISQGVNPVLQKQGEEGGRKGPLARKIEEVKRKRETTLPVDLEQKAAENKQITEAQKRANIEMRKRIRSKEVKEAEEKATKIIKNSPLGLTAAIERQIKEETGMTVGEITSWEKTDKS